MDRFGDADQVNSSNFNAMTLKFSEKFDHKCLLVILSHRFVAMPVTRYMFQCIPIKLVKGDEIVRPCDRHSNETWLSGNILRNINTCKNGWTNFSENLIIVTLKLLELTRFASPNQSIYFNFERYQGSVVMLTFLN